MKLTAVALACVCALTAQAQDPRTYQQDELTRLPRLFWDDAKGTLGAPAAWDASQWTWAGVAVAGVLGAGLVLDRRVDEAVVRNQRPSWNRAAKDVAEVGGTGGLVLMGAGYLGASLLGKEEARALWVDMGMATVLARGVITIPLKFLAGRSRPMDGQGAGHFRPFSSGDAFPSGHTAQAFAMASVVAARYDNPWVGGAAYGLASLVGLARLESREHFTSDVLAGALVGAFTGRTVARLNDGWRKAGGSRAEFTFAPAFGPGWSGVSLRAKF